MLADNNKRTDGSVAASIEVAIKSAIIFASSPDLTIDAHQVKPLRHRGPCSHPVFLWLYVWDTMTRSVPHHCHRCFLCLIEVVVFFIKDRCAGCALLVVGRRWWCWCFGRHFLLPWRGGGGGASVGASPHLVTTRTRTRQQQKQKQKQQQQQ